MRLSGTISRGDIARNSADIRTRLLGIIIRNYCQDNAILDKNLSIFYKINIDTDLRDLFLDYLKNSIIGMLIKDI